MTVTITVIEDMSPPEWDVARFRAHSDFPELEAMSQTREAAVMFVRGAVLCGLGQWPKPPISVLFQESP